MDLRRALRQAWDALPGWRLARSYRVEDLRHDVTAGLVLTALLLPAGMGYAELAGLPAVSGLHATVAALVAYAVLGPSRIMVLGPDSSLAPIIAAAVLPLAAGSPERALALAGLLSLLVGGVLLLGAAARLGFVADVLSHPIRIGYLNGIALVVTIAQVPKLTGFDVDASGLAASLRGVASGLLGGDAHLASTLIGVGSLVSILLVRRTTPRVPAMFVAVAGSGLVMALLAPEGVRVVGALPRALPAPALQGMGWPDVVALLPAALGIALVAFADTAVLSRALAGGRHDDAPSNGEMVALGGANIACGLLGGFPVSGSSSRTPAARESGARTQVAGLTGAVAVLLAVLAAPGLTRWLPQPTLAAVVVAAMVSLADIPAMARLWQMRRVEFTLGLCGTVGVALLGVIDGIGIAVVLSLLAFVARASRPHTAELVRVDRRKGYHDVGRHPRGRRVPGLLILRFDAPLFFANASTFATFVTSKVDDAEGPVRWVAVAAEPITDIDTTAAEMLVQLDDALAGDGVQLVFAEMKGPVKDRLAAYGLSDRFGPERHHPTVGRAVAAYLEATGTEFRDWTLG